jgi:ClpX C4-type zinc finger
MFRIISTKKLQEIRDDAAKRADEYMRTTDAAIAAKRKAEEELEAFKAKPTVYCSFCGKSEHQVKTMLEGQWSFICDECIEVAMGFLIEKKTQSEGGGMNMIEKVATAIYNLPVFDGDPIGVHLGHVPLIEVSANNALELQSMAMEICEQAAKAAIEAMREPSDAMMVAGGLKCEAMMFEDDPQATGVIFKDMGVVFTTMIDAELSNEGVKS